VALGSATGLKVAAVRAVWPAPDWSVAGEGVPSGVPEQPIGIEETRIGAMNRARRALAAVPTAEVAVGLENGMVEIDAPAKANANTKGARIWVDRACCIALVRTSPATATPTAAAAVSTGEGKSTGDGVDGVRVYEEWSADLLVPSELAATAVSAKGVITWTPLKDPHSHYAGRPRRLWLEDAVRALRKRIDADAAAPTATAATKGTAAAAPAPAAGTK
jgi:hypothetical protein